MVKLHLIRIGHPPRPDERFRRWLFLGKDPNLEAACKAAMPDNQQLDVTDRLQDIADRLRPEFAQEVARIGTAQKDTLGWCASTLAWKHPDVSDLFLLSCYRLLIRKLAIEPNKSTLIFLEDPWLYEDCRQDNSLKPFTVSIAPAFPLTFLKIRLLLRGAASRIIWAWRTTMAWMRQRSLAKLHSTISDNSAHYIYSVPHARCFSSEAGWNDPFFPGLEAMIVRNGGIVRRLIPTGAYGFAQEVAKRSDCVHPLILDTKPRNIIAAFTTIWQATALNTYKLEGLPMPLLAEREWWMDAGSARWCEYHLFNACFRRFLDKQKPASVIYPYENQPWEKLINLACSTTKTVTVAYQHSVVPPHFLSFWLGSQGLTESLPDHIMASSSFLKERLIRAGTPSTKIHVGGSLRFRYLASLPAKPQRRPNRPRRVLTLGNHTPVLTQKLLEAIRAAFPDGGAKDELALFFKAHPTAPSKQQRHAIGLKPVNGDLAAQLTEFDIVVTTGSTSALEAAFLGLPVILFRSATMLDSMDPGDMVPKWFFEYASAHEMHDKVLKHLMVPRNSNIDRKALCDAIFSTIDEQEWLRHLLTKQPQ